MENVTEIVNEVCVLAYIMHLRCFTDWIVDTNIRHNVGLSLISTVSLQIVFMVAIILMNIILSAILYCKKYYSILKHKKEMKSKNEIVIEVWKNPG